MSTPAFQADATLSLAEATIARLYHQLLACWNQRDSMAFAALFAETGTIIGFDGSQVAGREEIAQHLADIFANHLTPPYVGKVRSTRFLATTVALLSAVAGMPPPNSAVLDPTLNTIQTLLAIKEAEAWHIVLFQNTPAQFHGQPGAAQQLTEELQQLLITPDTTAI